ncbi:mechanosensitive ion channel family protein [Rhizobium bangladeshense]|uniref:Mechanosensitive ion channel family protein n=1 Tax=Rhizobium bangladeshense TaxID=1138189 RepID=A0ABS7LKW8_9HYPH|nr:MULTISPECIES: mechanosensitive ion channel family protein [Rhizobium]MBX4868866.1 mechanosensitive ion channel family protein [Rhizobium bangladeshense]MBX4873680.1 mechanosensitive ion channel family protein [Rhizobium bangladeshense]MBX4884679.1 mechanosensitive ion channel family protein [Rhizobium bangladeshense]MBX4933832.1 mechanosensitive ion channel family protein [Rhizobium bangladeshense]MBY3583458.1 mechanosensitive ion channel family protein [Rhizobium bangladeshense]
MTDFLNDIRAEGIWLPDWLASAVIFAVVISVTLFAHRILFRLLARLVESKDLFWRSLVSRLQRVVRLAMLVAALSLGATAAPLTDYQAATVRHVLLIFFIILIARMAKTAKHIWMTIYLRRFRLDAEDNLLARKHVTQTRIMERVIDLLIVVVAVSACLMTFDAVRQYGVSLLASAGVAGIVVGLALQPVLKNLFAGIQLAITQPIRIDDALLVEGEWGRVEEITSTYVVLQLWDWRRLVLPLSYFIEKPFQNWTRESSALIGTVMIYLDYSVPVEAIRARVEQIAKASTLWDGRVVNVAVTDFRETVMEIRILVSASNSGRTFDLRCEVREKLIDFIRREYPAALPRMRAVMNEQPAQDRRQAAE